MFTQGIFSQQPISQIMSSGGLDAAKSRIEQLQTMIQAMEAGRLDGAPKTKTGAFTSFLNTGVNAKVEAPLGPGGQSEAFQPLVKQISENYSLDKHLLNAIIRQESGFNPKAVSQAGAQGLMQLMPDTAKMLGVSQAFDPAQNLDAGARYLKDLLNRYNGNIPLALAAYNAGAGAVNKYKGIPPYKETQQYVRTILTHFLKSKQADG